MPGGAGGDGADDRTDELTQERHYPAELSGGMRKRVALARTLIYQPETLLMDEPFGALDAQLKLLMLDQLQELTRQRRMTVVFVTHDLGEAITLADRVVVFSARPGRIRTIRSVDLPRPRDVFRIQLHCRILPHLHGALWDELKDEVARGLGDVSGVGAWHSPPSRKGGNLRHPCHRRLSATTTRRIVCASDRWRCFCWPLEIPAEPPIRF